MADTIKVRLRTFAFHNGRRVRPGSVVDLSTEDFIDGKLPNWAEVCDETDREVLARHISANDAERQAVFAKRDADKAEAEAKAAAAKVETLSKKAQKAAEIAKKAAERGK